MQRNGIMSEICTPLGIVLVSSGSKGDNLLFRYPYEAEKKSSIVSYGQVGKNRFSLQSQIDSTWSNESSGVKDGMFYGYTDRILANILTTKTQLCSRCFELTIDDVKFVGYPTIVQDVNSKGTAEVSSRFTRPTMIMFNVVFVLNADVDKSLVQCYQDLSKRLAIALKHEERRSGYLSHQAAVMNGAKDEVAAMPEDAEESPFKLMLTKSKLCRDFREIFNGLSSHGTCHVFINNWIEVSFCLPHKVHNVCKMKNIQRSLMEESVSAIKPFHAVLLLEDQKTLWKALPKDCSPALKRLIAYSQPTKNLQEVAGDIDIHLSQVFQLVGHLVYWGKATVIFPVCENNKYILSPSAPTSSNSELHEEFQLQFPKVSLTKILAKFSVPDLLSDMKYASQKERCDYDIGEVVIWLLKRRLLTQLHTYVYIAPPTPSTNEAEGEESMPNTYTDLSELSKTWSEDLTDSPADKPSYGSSSGGHMENLSYDSDDLSFSTSYDMNSTSFAEDEQQHRAVIRRNIKHMLQDRLSSDERKAVLAVPAAQNQEDLKLFSRLCPYFSGKHHLEEIMYLANITRPHLHALLDKFKPVLITCTHQDAATITYQEFL